MKQPEIVEKYLSRQNVDNWKVELGKGRFYNNIIVVPALDEFANVQKLIESLSLNSHKYLSDTLIIFVVNNITDEKLEIIEENIKLLKYLRLRIKDKSLIINLGLIDAASSLKALPKKNGGVGFARKIGMDLALRYFDYSSYDKKILISLDADCLVSQNYLESIIKDYNEKNLNSAIVNFEHILPESENQKAAIINYEIFLRYYVLGLKYAGSHFAFPSIGSIITCEFESYIKIGGMNKRKAGEDFYFLEKLAKINEIHKVADATVFPSPRLSDRVPFGTGPRIKRFLNNTQNEYRLYSPQNFEILKKWLKVFNQELKIKTSSKNDIIPLMKKAKFIHNSLHRFLKEQNFKEDWENILWNSKSEKQLNKQKLNWMDGFRTLKLIHYLRDDANSNQEMFTSIDSLLSKLKIVCGLKAAGQIPPIEIQIKYLEILRSLT